VGFSLAEENINSQESLGCSDDNLRIYSHHSSIIISSIWFTQLSDTILAGDTIFIIFHCIHLFILQPLRDPEYLRKTKMAAKLFGVCKSTLGPSTGAGESLVEPVFSSLLPSHLICTTLEASGSQKQ
jgi:hypothetical protein